MERAQVRETICSFAPIASVVVAVILVVVVVVLVVVVVAINRILLGCFVLCVRYDKQMICGRKGARYSGHKAPHLRHDYNARKVTKHVQR